jgi:hypothetical protein
LTALHFLQLVGFFSASVPFWDAILLNTIFISISIFVSAQLAQLNRKAFTSYADRLEELNPIAKWLNKKKIMSIPKFAILMHYVTASCLISCGIILPGMFLVGSGLPLFLVLTFLGFMIMRIVNLASDNNQLRALANRP